MVWVNNEQGRCEWAKGPVEVALEVAVADKDPPVVGTDDPHAATMPTTESSERTESPRVRMAVRTVG